MALCDAGHTSAGFSTCGFFVAAAVYDPGMEQFTPEDTEPHGEIARIEERIEQLAMRLEGCRKYAAAALTGVIQLDAVTVMAAGAAVLGGIVLSGSNRSTTREIEAALAEAEAERAALIGSIDLRVVSERPRLH